MTNGVEKPVHPGAPYLPVPYRQTRAYQLRMFSVLLRCLDRGHRLNNVQIKGYVISGSLQRHAEMTLGIDNGLLRC
jgi:hypothetical protein